MDKLTKQQLLISINDLPESDLISFVESGDISIQEMAENGLESRKLRSLKSHFEHSSGPAPTPDESREEVLRLCREIENNQYNVFEIKNLILTETISKSDLLANTTISETEYNKILLYDRQELDFEEWDNLPEIEPNRTDVFFFGQPGSGKSCVLGSLFYFFREKGILMENMTNLIGTKYRNKLIDDFSYGILPWSTAVDGINYIPIELRNLNDGTHKHPLNFVEMSGEKFREAYEKGMEHLPPKLINYLSNKNRKLLFFVVDYQIHQESSKVQMGPRQESTLPAVLELLDRFGTLGHTDAIYVLVTKSDLFPDYQTKEEHAKAFMDGPFLNFSNNLREKVLKFQNQSKFKVTVIPYSIGKIRFKDLLVEINSESPHNVTARIQSHSFVSRPISGWRKIFG
jgi:hypothetical protein